MYRQFCKNLNYYYGMIAEDDGRGSDARKQVAEKILSLADLATYQENKRRDNENYKETNCLISHLSQYSGAYPILHRFIWELWAYGFDFDPSVGQERSIRDMDEIVKLIDLMLSTHYFQ